MSDDEPTSAQTPAIGSRVKSLTTWIGIVSSIITVVLTLWNAQTKAEIERAQVRMDSVRTSLEAARDRIARYQFVRSVLTGADSATGEQPTLSVNLVRLALDSAEAERLFAGLKSSRDSSLARVGSIGVAAIADQAVVALVQQMIGPDAGTRIRASQVLAERYGTSQAAVRQVLSVLEPPQIEALTPDGRINALVYLNATNADAWGAEELRRGRGALATLQRMSAANVVGIGERTRRFTADFERHLAAVTRSQQTDH